MNMSWDSLLLPPRFVLTSQGSALTSLSGIFFRFGCRFLQSVQQQLGSTFCLDPEVDIAHAHSKLTHVLLKHSQVRIQLVDPTALLARQTGHVREELNEDDTKADLACSK